MSQDIRHVVFHRPGPSWVAGQSPFEQPGIREHVEHYRPWAAAGKLAFGGPYTDGAGGGMMIPEAGLGREEVEAHALADPAVKSGLLLVAVRPWLIGMRRT